MSQGPGESVPRRNVLKLLAAAGVTAPVLARSLSAGAAGQVKIAEETIAQAEWITGLRFTEEERKLMLDDVNERNESFETLRKVPLDNAVAPSLVFDPAPHRVADEPRSRKSVSLRSRDRFPGNEEDVAFASVRRLAGWIRAKEISSEELTRLYLERLQRFDPKLECVISYTEDSAIAAARRLDDEAARGDWRGPLHGIPWGAKDLLAVPGTRTTWGAKPFRDQVRPERATVVEKLEEAGAVLVAKLTVGALAWGDVWFGGTTKNPWNLEQGSSGSSAGSASAVAAGLVGFAIGTETWGSIVSPCTRCGVTGLRPTFGRVSRHGVMALSWSMDKIGPITRSVEDAAFVFDAIQGRDGLDPTLKDSPFDWPSRRDAKKLRVGFVESLFDHDWGKDLEDETARQDAAEWRAADSAVLEQLEELGVELVPVELPSDLPVDELAFILTAEATTVFDELTRSGQDDLLVRQERFAWPNVFRHGHLIPAVEYLRANRIRSLLQTRMQALFDDVDAYVCPTFGGNNLLLTNLTGHPAVVVPHGFRGSNGTPFSITFQGDLFDETTVLGLAEAFQSSTDFHEKRPPLTA